MRHWYVVFEGGVNSAAARKLLKKLGAEPEHGQPPVPLDGGDVTLAVTGPDDLRDRAKDLPGVSVYDNQTHQELF